MSHSLMDAYFKAIYDAWVREAVLYAFIKMPLEHEIQMLVGHNPQLLLAPPDRKRTFHERMEVWRNYGDLEAHGLKLPDRSKHPLAPHDLDYIEAAAEEPLMQPRESTFATQPWLTFDKETLDRLMGISYDDMVKMMFPASEIISARPIEFAPTGRLVYDAAIKPARQEGETVQTRFHMSSDFSKLEMMALLATLQYETADQVILELSPHGGEIASAYSLMGQSAGQLADMLHTFSRAAAKSKRLPKQPDYLKHDKTKNHRRPRR